MNHENASAAQAIAVGVGAAVEFFAPGHGAQVVTVVGGIFALLGVIKPFLPAKIQSAY